MSSRLTVLANNLQEEQFHYPIKLLFGLSIFFAAFFSLSMSFYLGGLTHAATDTVNKIHVMGKTPESEIIGWRGPEQGIYYGLNTSYGSFGIASGNAAQDNSEEPSLQVQLTGLKPATTYHYKIGLYGMDHTFRTIPDKY